ncbi:hypothetical protein ACJZ2D_003575 [Fusarium nematophilum]
MDDIAVVGIGLRFPGNASSPEQLWKVLERGESQWSEFPKDRLNIDGYYHPGGDRQGSISFRGAHFLKGDFASFDASFFSVAAEDAKAIDPQQRILLEASYEALENAGIRKEDIDGSDAAVYVGSFVKDYEQVCLRDPDWQPQYAATGNGIAIMANRISYFFNLHGPSMTIDTGCSGSLVSVHLAAQSLRTGETSLAIAAGAGMILTPNTIMPMTALNFLSPDGKCFTFDARANGYGRGEGIGVVILKRLSDALRDNDTIRAVIRGTRVNQDGHTTGITLPSKEAQVANISSIYESAGLDFNQTAYVECHGTGTQAGDWRELKAISETLGSVRAVDNPIVVGSLKPNIGHLEGAAGVAGLIKGVLTLEHGKIPPNINFEKGNPDIDFESWKVKVPTKMLDWPVSGLRRVSVNCFGFGGTNAHVILDEAPRYMSARGLTGNHNSFEEIGSAQAARSISKPHAAGFEPQLFCFSSHEKSGVRRVVDSHLPYLNSNKGNETDFLRNYAYTLGSRRSNLEWKHAIVAKSRADLIDKLQNIDDAQFKRASKNKQPRICFIFCGQGAQSAQMGRDLLPFEAFRDSLEAASHYMKETLGSPFDLLQEILKDEGESRISDPRIAQPATTALQVALIDLFASFLITPTYVVGHSSGEIAAAFASGALGREAAWEVAYYRGVAASSVTLKVPEYQGAMMVVGLSVPDVNAHFKGSDYSCEIACVNSPRSTTLSGKKESIERAFNDFSAKNIFCRILPVKIAYHSSHMRLVENEYKAALGLVAPREHFKTVMMFSTLFGQRVAGRELDKLYWATNLVSPVHYVGAIESMMSLPAEERPDMILELSPAAALRSPTLDIISSMGLKSPPTYHSVLERKCHGAISLLQAIGDLWSRGCPLSMKKVVSRGSCQVPLKCLADLPPYPWDHTKSYWHESHLGQANRFREFPRQDLIGAPTSDFISFEPRWRGFLRISENPWIQDHQVQKTIIYPAAGMVTMALEGARQVTKNKDNLLGYEITNMRIDRAMIVPGTAHGLEMAMNFKRASADSVDQTNATSFEFTIYSKQLGAPWQQNATGLLQVRYKQGRWQATFRKHQATYDSFQASCKESLVPRQLYELLDIVGMNYGASFQNITQISKGGNACISKVRVPDTKSKMPANFEYDHLIHPGTLDSMFQTLFAIDNEPMVPTFIKSIFVSADVSRQIGSEFTGYATATRVGIRDATADIAMAQSGWAKPSVVIGGLHFSGLSGSSPAAGGFLPNHRTLCTQIGWQEDVNFMKTGSLEIFVRWLGFKYPGLSVLQVGGSSATAQRLVGSLRHTPNDKPWFTRYTVAQVSPDENTLDVLSKFKGTPIENFIEKRPVDGSEPLPGYNLILVCTQDSNIPNLSSHLKKPGYLVECYQPAEAESPQGQVLVHSYTENAKKTDMKFRVRRHEQAYDLSSMPDLIVLLPDQPHPEAQSLARKIVQNRGRVLLVGIMHLSEVLIKPARLRGRVVISLLDFSAKGDSHPSVFNWGDTHFNAFHAVQKLSAGIIWVTRGAHMLPVNPKGSPIIALARTLISEDPLKAIVTLDLNCDTPLLSVSALQNIYSVFFQTFKPDQGSAPRELEYAELQGRLYIPRLIPIPELNEIVENGTSNDVSKVPFHHYPRQLMLHIAQPGLVDGGMIFSADTTFSPKPGEVEVIFESATINFLDLDTVMGRTVDSKIGSDVCGRVRRIGRNVSGFMPDDMVAGLVADGSIRSNANIDSRLVRKWSSNLPMSQVVSAYHALSKIGRLGQGKSVLIHAGASSFGVAAIIVASQLSADTFVTVMGPNACRQRTVLTKLGLKKDHILEADSDSFVKIVCDLTGGRGVDAVYNSTQRHLEANFQCVRKGGVVIQFASKSPGPPAVRVTSSSASFVNFDLSILLSEEPDYVSELLDETVKLAQDFEESFTAGSDLVKSFELSNLKGAFELLEASPFLGFISITGGPKAAPLVEIATPKKIKSLGEALSGNGTYLLAGGLGGLGRSICELLVKNGVQHIAFLSRSGASSTAARGFLEDLKKKGVDAQVYQADICDKKALEEVVKEQIALDMPPIKGVFQCAAVIKDTIFDNMTYSDWATAIKPKTIGSDNLVNIISAVSNDPFFIFLASSAGVIGNRGQANYAAGNCFEDCLARNLRLQGKHAVSIDLGPVLGAGMLAEDAQVLDILRASGFYGIRHQDFLTMVTHAITMEVAPNVPMPAQIIMGIGTGGLVHQNLPADPYWSRTAMYGYLNLVDMPDPDLTVVDDSAGVDLRSMLSCCTDAESASEIVCTGLAHMLAKAMNMLPEEINTGSPPNVYGVDSLAAVAVRNWVVSNCGVEVSVFEVLSDKTVAELAADIAAKGGFGLEKN